MSLFCNLNEENIIYEHIDGHDDWATAPPKTTLGSVGYPSRNGNIGLKWGGWGDNVITPPSGSVFILRMYTHRNNWGLGWGEDYINPPKGPPLPNVASKNNPSSMPRNRAYNSNYKRLTNALHSHEFSSRRMKYVRRKACVGFLYMMCSKHGKEEGVMVV